MTLIIDGKTYEAGELIAYVQDLEKENAELKADNDARKFAMAMSEKVEKQLREEIAELDCQKNRNKYCYSCANATERCFKNEIGCPCDKYKSYKEDLEQKISVLLSCKNCSENKKPNFLYLKHDMVDAIAYAIYYTANPDSEMCVPNCAYIQAEKMFEKWKEEK